MNAPAATPQRPTRLLVVDDDLDTGANLADILSDIGLTLMEDIHRQQPQTRTVLLTGNRHELSQQLEKNPFHGVDVFFYKPLEMDDFLGTLQRWTSR